MPFTLTSRQYAKIDAVTQGLPPSQQHSYLARLAGKISRHSRENRKRALTDAVLAALIADALHELRAKAAWSRLQPPQERQGSGEDCVDVTAKELDRLIAAGTSTKIKTSL